jgi:hypothetical protein
MTLSIVREQIIEQQQETRDLANRALLGPALAQPAPDAAVRTPAESATPPREGANVFGLQLSTFAQLILAGIIPWLLAAAALPLETIVRNSVFIVSIFASFALVFLGFLSKTISSVFKNVGVFVLAIYDFIIFLPLFIQRRFMQRGRLQEGSGPARDLNDDLMLSERAPTKAPKREKARQAEQELEKAS